MIYNKDGKSLAYQIKRKKIKHTYLRLKGKEVIITTNHLTQMPYLMNLLNMHFDKFYHATCKTELPDNTWMLWGKPYRVIEQALPILYQVDSLNQTIYVSQKAIRDEVKERLYQSETENRITLEWVTMKEQLAKHQLWCKKITVKPMTTRYGSCSYHKKTISMNRYLAKIDPIFLRYVLYHEFAHLRHPNHSKAYHDFLSLLFPEAQEVRKMLKKQRIS